MEHGSFTPLVFLCFYGNLVKKPEKKRNIKTSKATCFIRTKIKVSDDVPCINRVLSYESMMTMVSMLRKKIEKMTADSIRTNLTRRMRYDTVEK